VSIDHEKPGCRRAFIIASIFRLLMMSNSSVTSHTAHENSAAFLVLVIKCRKNLRLEVMG